MTTAPFRMQKKAGWSQTLSYTFLFMILPLLFVYTLGNAVIRQNRELMRTGSLGQLEKRAEAICSFLDPAAFFEDRCRRFSQAIDWQSINETTVRQLYDDFSMAELGIIPYVFKNGGLITPEDLLENTGERISELWLYFHGRITRTNLQHKTDAHAWFGRGFSRLHNKGSSGAPSEFNGRKGKGLISIMPGRPHDKLEGLFFVAWTIPEAERTIKFLPENLKKDLQIKISSRGAAGDGWIARKSASDGNSEFVVRRTMENRFLYFHQRFPELKSVVPQTLLSVLVMVLMLTLATILRDPILMTRINGLSVKVKLVALIGYSVIIPLAALGYFGWKYVEEHRELLQQEALIACHANLNDLETGFNQEKQNVLKRYRSYADLPDMATNTRVLQKHFLRLERQQKMNWIEIRDINSGVLVSTQDPASSDKIGVVGKVFARHGITSFLAERIPPQHIDVPSAGEIILQEFLESPLGGWARIFESPDELHEISFGGYNLFWYWNIFPQKDYLPAFILADQHIRWSVGQYLHATLSQRTAHEQWTLRRLFWAMESDAMISADDEKPTGELKNFIARVIRNGSAQDAEIEWRGEKWLIAGAPGKRLAGNVIMSLYPMVQIDRQIDLIVSDLAWGVILALILALLVGRIFSHTITSPLVQLMQGVQALRSRDTSKRIAILQNDELGRLSANFNRTIETLEDVLFAKTIQRQLIQQTAPNIAGYSADIFYQPAADLGGDYCDVQQIDDKNWLFVIGDVTGHGVSSALVTAMAKAVVCQSMADNKFSLAEAFACLNDLLYSQFKRKKCMTFFAGLLDITTGKLSCINAGHPLPLHFSAGKRQQFPGLFHAPLGFNIGRHGFPEANISLHQDDCLILYTDVFVELHDRNGQPLGTSGFAALCGEYLHLPVEQMRMAILERVQTIASAELDDDLTLIILKKVRKIPDQCLKRAAAGQLPVIAAVN